MTSIQHLAQSFLLRTAPLTLLFTVVLTPLFPLQKEGLLLLLLSFAILPIELAFFVSLSSIYYTSVPIVAVSFIMASLIGLYGPKHPLNHLEISSRALHRPLRRFLYGVNEIINVFLVSAFNYCSDVPAATIPITAVPVSASNSSSSNAPPTPKGAPFTAFPSGASGPPGGDDGGYSSGDEAAATRGGAAGAVGGIIAPGS
jgi:hypothetical protein